ncbi:hypothetical protein KEJ34_02065 [Candidatus Bathyarchaeota archaeon]|nr:hypothetical protein [Candidatus Bathyarchaeota archaeon]
MTSCSQSGIMKDKRCIFLILLLIYSEAFLVMHQTHQVQAQQEPRWWAGYRHYGVAQIYSHPGVYGEIYTINPYVPVGAYFLEWVATILAYRPIAYWVQVGYFKYWTYNAPHYYVEKNDSKGHDFYVFGVGPSTGSWHSYATRRPADLPWENSTDPKEWRLYIDNMLNPVRIYFVTPNRPVDEQAFAEVVVSTGICITGSHFRNLRVYDPQLYWFFWQCHVLRVDPPYTLIEISHREFRAAGGG